MVSRGGGGRGELTSSMHASPIPLQIVCAREDASHGRAGPVKVAFEVGLVCWSLRARSLAAVRTASKPRSGRESSRTPDGLDVSSKRRYWRGGQGSSERFSMSLSCVLLPRGQHGRVDEMVGGASSHSRRGRFGSSQSSPGRRQTISRQTGRLSALYDSLRTDQAWLKEQIRN